MNHWRKRTEVMGKNAELFGEASTRFLDCLYQAIVEAESNDFSRRFKTLKNPQRHIATIEEFISSRELVDDIYVNHILDLVVADVSRIYQNNEKVQLDLNRIQQEQ